jgi:hypothetical protein
MSEYILRYEKSGNTLYENIPQVQLGNLDKET